MVQCSLIAQISIAVNKEEAANFFEKIDMILLFEKICKYNFLHKFFNQILIYIHMTKHVLFFIQTILLLLYQTVISIINNDVFLMLSQVFSKPSQQENEIFNQISICDNISCSTISTCSLNLNGELMKFIDHTFEHIVSFHILLVVLLILWTDYQLNFGKFFKQQIPLIKVVDEYFYCLTPHTSVGLLSKHEIQEKLVQLILVIILLSFPSLLTLVLHVSIASFFIVFLNQLVMDASPSTFLTVISFDRIALIIDF